MQKLKNFNLKQYNSFGLESVAKEIWFPEDLIDLVNLVKQLKNDKYYILSRGTNVLLNKYIDKVICLRLMNDEINFLENGIVLVQSNCSLQTLVKKSINNNLGSLEGLIGIPGTVGGAIVGNSGSKDYTISDCLVSITTLNKDGIYRHWKRDDLKFSRRYSIIQDNDDIIISALFNLKKKVNHKDLVYYTNSRRSIPQGKSAGGIWKQWHLLKSFEKELIGLSDGDAIISDRVNIIINKGNATCSNILNLIAKTSDIVKKPLELEIKLLGFDND